MKTYSVTPEPESYLVKTDIWVSAYVTCRKQTTGAASDKKLYSQTRLIKKTGPTHVTPIAQNGRDCDRELDITDKLCPLTFVHTRLTIDSMQPGTVLAIVLNKGEPLENVPRSLKELGHKVISIKPASNPLGSYRLLVLIGGKTLEESNL